MGERFGFDLDTPLEKFSDEAMDILLNGSGNETYDVIRYFGGEAHKQKAKFDGLLNIIQQRMNMQNNNDYYDEFVEDAPCPACNGRRLAPAPLSVTVGNLSIDKFCDMQIKYELDAINNLELTSTEEAIAKVIFKEIRSRLGFLSSVGLDYLTLSRKAGSLSGGEAQRIRLATQIGSSLVGVLYILDEPSIGLHQRDNSKLIATLK